MSLLAPRIAVVAFAFALAQGGCTFHAFSPPGRVVLLESAQTLDKDQTSVALEGGAGGMAFANYAVYGSLRARRGMSDNVEMTVDISAGYVDGPTFDCQGTDDGCRPGQARGGGAGLRVGAKWAPWKRHLAFTGGVGGGGSLFGGMLALDVGVIASYDNPYVVPFLSTSVGVSIPFNARLLQYGAAADMADTTFVWPISIGVKVPLGGAEGQLRGALLGGGGILYLNDGEETATAGLLSLGGELTF